MWGGVSILSPPPPHLPQARGRQRTSSELGTVLARQNPGASFQTPPRPEEETRSQGSSVSRPQATELRGRSAVPGPPGQPCLLCGPHGVNSPDLRSRVPPTLRPDPLLPPHTPNVQRILILGGPPLKAMCPHPFLPGLGKTRASVSARPKGAHLQY